MNKIEAMTDAMQKLDILEGKRKANQLTTDAEKECKDALKEVNKAIIAEKVGDFLTMRDNSGLSAMLTGYIGHQFVDGVKLEQDKDTGEYSFGTAVRRVSFLSLDKASKEKITTNGAWMKYVRIFNDNILRFIADEKGEASAFTKEQLPEDYMKLRAEKGWGSKMSINALTGQLQEIVNMILPADIAPHMIKADTKYLRSALLTVKSTKADVAGQVSVRSEEKMEEFLFRAIYTRSNGLAYAFQNEKTDKTPASQAQPGEGGESKPDTGAIAKGGDVVVVAMAQPETTPATV